MARHRIVNAKENMKEKIEIYNKQLSKKDYIKKKSGMKEKGRDDGPHNFRRWLGKRRQRMSEWISVKDRLPHKYERVLVTDGERVCIHYKQSGVNFSDELGHDLYCSCSLNYDRCDFVEGDITHWMELPDPPLARKEEAGNE